MKIRILVLCFLACMTACSCSRSNHIESPDQNTSIMVPEDTGNTAVFIDCSKKIGKVMRIEQDNDMSSSVLPPAKTKAWVQSLDHHLIRVWIQLRRVYNNGDIDYNCKYIGSNVHIEDELAFSSACADSLLIVLSAYNPTSSWRLPAGSDFEDFVRTCMIHYKKKFPRIKYMTVGNEPDHAGETMAAYYPVYQHYYKALKEANDSLHLQHDRILIGNGAFTGSMEGMLRYADGFLKAYAADPDPDKRLDFFSFNNYAESGRPSALLDARKKIDSAMKSNRLPRVPVFVTEYGAIGGPNIPAVLGLGGTITMWAPAQLTKAFYLYEGGINEVFNWYISGSYENKSEIADVNNAWPYPYGYALQFCREISDRQMRIEAVSKMADAKGIGIHALASMGNDQGVAAMIWNYNWKSDVPDKAVNIQIRNIPANAFKSKKMHTRLYILDSKHNNYYYSKAQNHLTASEEGVIDYAPSVTLPVTLEKNAVALILLTPD